MFRRKFLVTAAAAACPALISRPLFAASEFVDGRTFGATKSVRSRTTIVSATRLWMWGHDAGSLGSYIPEEEGGGRILPAAAIKTMGIPNVCMVPFTGTPRPEEYDGYARQFNDPAIKRLTWSFVHASREDTQAIKAAALRQAAKYGNFVGLDMDDFFRGHLNASTTDRPVSIAPAALTPHKCRRSKELDTTAPKCRGRKLDLSIVCTPIRSSRDQAAYRPG